MMIIAFMGDSIFIYQLSR